MCHIQREIPIQVVKISNGKHFVTDKMPHIAVLEEINMRIFSSQTTI